MTIKATTKALLGTAVSFALLGTAGIANAADLDNLSDDDLLARIERLEKIIGPGDNNAQRTGNDKIRVQFSGQFHRIILGFNDGEDTFVGVVDNTNLSSRVRWRVSGQLNDDISVSGILEADIDTGTESGEINQLGLNFDAGNNAAEFGLRHAAFTIASKTFGGLTLGQFNTASNGSTENDFSGTDFILYPEQEGIGGGILLNDQAGNFIPGVTVSDFITVSDFTGDFDGTNRDDVIRYDSPRFAGFGVAASYTNGANYAVSGSYRNADLAGFGIGATVAYSALEGQEIISSGSVAALAADDSDLISGSIAAIHLATGFNAAFAFGFAGDGAGDNGGSFTGTQLSGTLDAISIAPSEGGSQLYGKVGWIGDVISLGKTSLAADISFNRNVANEGSRYRGISVAANQTIAKIATDLYIGYRNLSIEESGIAGVDFQDVNLFFAGGRVSF